MLSLKIQKFLNEHIETLTHKIKAIELLESSISVEDSIYDLRDTQQLSNQYKICLTKIKEFIDLLNQKANMLPIKDSSLPSKQDQVTARLRNLYYLQQKLKSLIPEISQLSDEEELNELLITLSKMPPEALILGKPFNTPKNHTPPEKQNEQVANQLVKISKEVLEIQPHTQLSYNLSFINVKSMIDDIILNQNLKGKHLNLINLFIQSLNTLRSYIKKENTRTSDSSNYTPLSKNIRILNIAYLSLPLQKTLIALADSLPEFMHTQLRYAHAITCQLGFAKIIIGESKKNIKQFNILLHKALENTLLKYESTIYGCTLGFYDNEYHTNIKMGKEIYQQLENSSQPYAFELLFLITNNWDSKSFNAILMDELLKASINAYLPNQHNTIDKFDFKAIAEEVFNSVPLSLENKAFVCDAEKPCSDTEQSIPSIFCDEIIKSNSQPQPDETPNP